MLEQCFYNNGSVDDSFEIEREVKARFFAIMAVLVLVL